jgi:hypothetical protein
MGFTPLNFRNLTRAGLITYERISAGGFRFELTQAGLGLVARGGTLVDQGAPQEEWLTYPVAIQRYKRTRSRFQQLVRENIVRAKLDGRKRLLSARDLDRHMGRLP